MVRSPGIAVPASEAEKRRRKLQEQGLLRTDLRPARRGNEVLLPLHGGDVEFDFDPQEERASDYRELLPEGLRLEAPRAFEHMGDVAIVKVPPDLMEQASTIGEAIQEFKRCRAVFHDDGVVGDHRTRRLTRIAGEGESLTRLRENGATLWVDVARAYFSPRLATERHRMCDRMGSQETLIDLFGGVAPLGVQAARKGVEVISVEWNPDAVALAKKNVQENRVGDRVRLIEGDARVAADKLPAADHVAMNLPHGAREFLDVALPLVRPGGILHYHEILPRDEEGKRIRTLLATMEELGRVGRVIEVRHVRTYSPQDDHLAIDVELA